MLFADNYITAFIIKTFAFGVFGLGLEVIFSSIYSLFGWERAFSKYFARPGWMLGYSSAWYFPPYAGVYLLFYFLRQWIFWIPWFIRIPLYGVVFLIIEFVWMSFMKLFLKKTPSEDNYKKSKWNIRGMVRLDYYPFYCPAGLLMELLFLVMV